MPERRRLSEMDGRLLLLLLCGELPWPRDGRCERSAAAGGRGEGDRVLLLLLLLLLLFPSTDDGQLRGCRGEDVVERDGGRELRSGGMTTGKRPAGRQVNCQDGK